MPLYDYNGTNNSEIGKVYDYNGTDNHQIGKVYDDDGTASRLIYTAETQIYPGASIQTIATTNSGSYGSFYSKLGTKAAPTNVNSVAVFIRIDLTNYKSLTITGSFTSSGYYSFAGTWLSNPTQYGQYNMRHPTYTIGQASSSEYYVRMARSANGGACSSTITWDVSSLSGTYYLGVGCYLNSGNTVSANAEITKVVAQ